MSTAEEKAEKIQRDLFRNICREVTDEELVQIKQELKQKAFGGFKSGEIERELKTASDILEKLKRKGLIKLGDYGFVRKLAIAIESVPLQRYVDEAENSLIAMHWPVKLSKSDAPQGYPMPEPMGFGPHGGQYQQPPPYHGYDSPSHASSTYQQGMTGAPPHSAHHAGPRQPYTSYQDSSGRFAQHDRYQQGGAAPSHRAQTTADPTYSYQGGNTGAPRQHTSFPDMHSRSGSSSGQSPDDVFVPPMNIPFDVRSQYEPGRGYVLFINNLFTGKSDYRRGAENDHQNVQSLFAGVLKNFYLQYEQDVSLQQLQGYLRGLKETLSSGLYKSFILILGTHGEPRKDGTNIAMKDAVLMADNKWMLVDEIVKNFHGDQIPAMKDKPKVFIIQSCRGKQIQRSVSLSDSPADLSNQVPIVYLQPEVDFMTRPVNSDILIAYATSEGTKAWRNEEEGSWFVKDLCDVIREYCRKEHMLDILVRVNSQMVWREATENRGKQMPCFVCTFTKKFMLAFPNH